MQAYISTDGGTTWSTIGQEINLTDTLNEYSISEFQQGSVRIQLNTVAGGRINVDDIRIEPYFEPNAINVTIRDLNTYDNLENFEDISNHPLRGELVRLTAIVVSNPKTSGLAAFNPDETPSIGRIHFFVTDTTA